MKQGNSKTFRRNLQHLCQVADSSGADDTILISDGKEENSLEQEVIAKREESSEDDHLDKSNEVRT